MSVAMRLLRICAAGIFCHAALAGHAKAVVTGGGPCVKFESRTIETDCQIQPFSRSINLLRAAYFPGEKITEASKSRELWMYLAQVDKSPSELPFEDNAPLARNGIREVQRLLLERGFNPGPIDGKLGPGTATAISLFQKSVGLPADGIPTRHLLQQLRGDISTGMPPAQPKETNQDPPVQSGGDIAPPGSSENSSVATSRQDTIAATLSGTTWLFQDEAGSEFSLTFEMGGTVQGAVYGRFWKWQQQGNDVEILYDNKLGLTVNRVGILKGEGLMEGIALPSRGDGWSWKAQRTSPPVMDSGTIDAKPGDVEQPSGSTGSGASTTESTDAVPSHEENTTEAGPAFEKPQVGPAAGANESGPSGSQPKVNIGVQEKMSSLKYEEEPAMQSPNPSPPEQAQPLSPAETPAATNGQKSDSEKPPVVAEESAKRDPKIYGSENADGRIVIRAIADSWIEVLDAEGNPLFSRVLRDGDSYRVPVLQGARFVTGNAGGLEILVDGEPAPSLGPSTKVRRDVRLDPDLLKAGTAWSPQ